MIDDRLSTNIQNFSKIAIFGRPGSGKSTLALALSKNLNLPLHHLDRYFFEANWIERNYQEFLDIQQEMVDSEKWIVDGNNPKSLEMRYAKADIVLFLNLPIWKCYWRVFRRLFYKDQAIQDRAEGCSERVSWSLLKYMWNYNENVFGLIKSLREKYPLVTFIEIRNDYEAQNLVLHLVNKK